MGVFLTLHNPVDEATAGEEGPPKPKGKKAKKAAAEAQRRQDEMAVSGVFVHRSALAPADGGSDGRDWETKYKPGKPMRVRVMGHHLVEGVAVGSSVESFVDGSVVHSSQVSRPATSYDTIPYQCHVYR